MAELVVRDFSGEPFDKFGSLRPRAYKFHVAPEHIPQLWNLIPTGEAQEFAYSCNARIIVTGPSGTAVGFCIGTHRAEFITIEDPALESDSLLSV